MVDHYFSAQPSSDDGHRSTVILQADGEAVELQVSKGVFSTRKVDRGTQILLDAVLPPTTDGELLDLGCGYGPIAVTLARRFPDRKVWAVDVNPRAVALTRDNARNLGLDNIDARLVEEVPEGLVLAGIWSNPPIKVGKAVLHEMLERWTVRLAPGATAYLVVQKHLGSDSLAAWLRGRGLDVARVSSKSGYRILAARSVA